MKKQITTEKIVPAEPSAAGLTGEGGVTERLSFPDASGKRMDAKSTTT